MTTLPPPARAFASDNAAGAHPAVMEALHEANEGHALAYGDDRWTAENSARMRELFGPHATTLLVWNGTGANVVGLASLLGPAQAVICTNWAHINVDETGAPERILGAKLIDLDCPDGKLVPEQIEDQAHALGDMHHAQPGVVSLTQSTEIGTIYSADEIAALCETAHRHGMSVHLDGARLANAVAASGRSVDALRAMTVDAGVDVLSFGATKNGLMYGEAVVCLTARAAMVAPFVRKQTTQLPSKMRFVAAQLNALLRDDLWIDLAGRANEMAMRLYERTVDIPGVVHDTAPVVNSVFPHLPADAIRPLQEWCFFWDWHVASHQVRWMTAWDTTEDDVDQFAAGVRHHLLG
ncbi:MAG: ltaE 1 [Ilumatobacteraceae bacterium]|nr:ltaE 1 [Ilumatobacteraceae bacterium]MCU1389702.1 ltaE 1 [Ilumatobacteraceae bacterium]